jgi:MFS family permease
LLRTPPGDGTVFLFNTDFRIFYINIPIVIIVVIGIWFFLTLKTETTTLKEKLKRIDVIGIIFFVGSCTSFLFGITAGGVLFPWNAANVLAPLVIGAVGLVAFWAIEELVPKEPMMPMRVFKQRTAFAAYIGTIAHGIILWGIIYYGILFVLSLLHQN